MPKLSGVLLAGGLSTRMGTDKAVLLGERTAAVLIAACEDVVVASGDGQRLAWLGLPQVPDALPDSGPLSGLVAGLEAATHELVAVLAVDMPDARADVLGRLAEVWDGEPAVVPVVDGQAHPLHAVWARGALPALREQLTRGELGLIAAASALEARFVGQDVWGPADPGFARNVNSPGDL